MFFRKTERKRHSACVILTIGALATIGAISVVKDGKQMINELGKKVKSFLKKDGCECPTIHEE